MVDLREIANITQDIAEAIKAAFQMDVEIIDRNIVRIAATGSAKNNLGNKMSYGTVTQDVLQNHSPIIINDIGNHEHCKRCSGLGKCNYTGGIIVPIRNDGETIGTINLVAYDQSKLDEINRNQEGLVDFLNKMSDLISVKLREQALFENQRQVNSALLTVINSVPNGIVSIDVSGKVMHLNHLAKKMLQLSMTESDEDVWLPTIISDLPLSQIMAGEELTNTELTAKIKADLYRFIADIRPIIINDSVHGAVITFYDYDRMKQLAFEFTNPDRQITFNDIICGSPLMKNVKSKAYHFAKSNSTILIMGESGTGKEMFARAIHEASPRSKQPFISINCGAIPEALIESELFGYEKGAFTGANSKGKPGKFELANHGTIFLDEIGTMPLYLQVKLLRVLQAREIDKVGGTETIPIDVRIIAATNSDLEEMVQNGTFRQDLYYRLNVIPIELPPLRERKQDVDALAEYFVSKYASLLQRNIEEISEEAMHVLKQYDWPGNIRELENVIEYSINLAGEAQSRLVTEHLPGRILHSSDQVKENRYKSSQQAESAHVMRKDEYEKRQIDLLLQQLGTSTRAKKAIAKQLGISLATLYRKIQFYQIEKESF